MIIVQIQFKVQFIVQSSNTIKNQLVKIKDQRKAEEKINLVYEINCQNCSNKYIG